MPYSKKHALAAAAAVALLTCPNALQASQPYDGNWSVRAFPNSGTSCEGNYQLRVQVSEGAVTYVGRGTAHAVGGIQPDGILKVTFHAEGDQLDARGASRIPFNSVDKKELANTSPCPTPENSRTSDSADLVPK